MIFITHIPLFRSVIAKGNVVDNEAVSCNPIINFLLVLRLTDLVLIPAVIKLD